MAPTGEIHANYMSFWTQAANATQPQPAGRDAPHMTPPATPRPVVAVHPDANEDVRREMQRMKAMNDKLHAKVDQDRRERDRGDNRGGDREGDRGGDRGKNNGGKNQGGKGGNRGKGGDRRGDDKRPRRDEHSRKR